MEKTEMMKKYEEETRNDAIEVPDDGIPCATIWYIDYLEAKSTAYDKLVDDDFVTKIKELIESMPEDTEWWCPNCGVTECSCDGRCTQCGCLLDESQPESLKDFFKSLFERFILPNGDNHV